jgi:protein O-mannosyl-transferase
LVNPDHPLPNRQRILLCGIVVFLLTFLFYSPILRYGYVNWDDGLLITNNPTIQKLDGPHVVNLFTTFECGSYTPLSRLSLAIDWRIWNADPRGIHFTSLILHSLNAALVFILALLIFRRVSGATSSHGTGILLTAAAGALVFAIHPLKVESVAWASERRDVLCGFFALLSTITYLKYASQSDEPGERRRYLFPLTYLLFLASLLSKAMSVGLPLVFLFIDYFPLRRFQGKSNPARRTLHLFVEKTPFLFTSLIIGCATLFQFQERETAIDLEVMGWEDRLSQSFVTTILYVSKFLVPLSLNPLYKKHHSFGFDQPQVLFCLGLVLLGLLVCGWLFFKRHTAAPAVAGSSFLVLILPFVGLTQTGYQLIADRYTYLATLPLGILIVGCAWRFTPSWRRLFVPILAAWMVWIAWTTFRQIPIWRDSVTLWSHSVNLDDRNPIAWMNLGTAHLDSGNLSEARRCLEKTLELAPHSANTHFNLGLLATKEGDPDTAKIHYVNSLKWKPSDPDTLLAIGNLYLIEGVPLEARRMFFHAACVASAPKIWTHLGAALLQSGEERLGYKYLLRSVETGQREAVLIWSDLLRANGREKEANQLINHFKVNTAPTHHPSP